MRVQRTVAIDASPERIYEVIMDPFYLERWVTIHTALVHAPHVPLQRGSELTQRLQLAGRRFTVHWQVIENVPARRVVWEGSGPLRSHAGVTYELDPVDGGTSFTYTNDFALPGGPLGKFAGPVVRRVTAGELDRSLERLRALVE